MNYKVYEEIEIFLKDNMHKKDISKLIDDINSKAKDINQKQAVQLYNVYRFLFDEYGLDEKYIKPDFNKEQSEILNANLYDFIDKAKKNNWLRNKSANHVGSGLGRNIPLLIYLGCSKVVGIDFDSKILDISQSFINLFTFKDRVELINENFLDFSGLVCDVFYYIGGTIKLNTSMEMVKFNIAMNKVLQSYETIIYTKDLFQSFDDFKIIERLLENNNHFKKLYNNSGFYIYQRK